MRKWIINKNIKKWETIAPKLKKWKNAVNAG